jgi:hypothetical protein
MSEFIVTLTMKYRVRAPDKKAASQKVHDRICAPEDDPPGDLEYWKVTSKEVGA